MRPRLRVMGLGSQTNGQTRLATCRTARAQTRRNSRHRHPRHAGQNGQCSQAVAAHLLKLKLGGAGDLERLAAVHLARPDARLIVDGNEGMAEDTFADFVSKAGALGVVLIEQPFPADADASLGQIRSNVAICADESAHTASNIPDLATRYDAVIVKLDKAGGLTEALAMVKAARAAKMQIMVGCMVAGSLSMAPAVLLAQLADIVDLDGPLWLAEDAPYGLAYDDGQVSPPSQALWG